MIHIFENSECVISTKTENNEAIDEAHFQFHFVDNHPMPCLKESTISGKIESNNCGNMIIFRHLVPLYF